MKVLVTGWAGYLGPHVVSQLKRHGHYVIGLDTGWFLPVYQETPDYPHETLFMDIRDAWLDDFDVDCIVHLAGLSNDPMADIDPELTSDINFRGTTALIGTNDDKRHVIASSCSVYGTAEMATEETEPAPLTAYAKAKANVDRFAEGIEGAVSLRFGTLWGYSPGHRLDLVVNRMAYDSLHGRGVTVYGNAARPLTHVEDAAAAVVLAVEHPEIAGGVLNVVGENWRMQQLGKFVQENTNCNLYFRPSGGDARDYSALGTKLMALGWEAKRTLADDFDRLLIRSFDLDLPSRLTRLDVLNELRRTKYLDSSLRSPAAP